MIGVGRASIAIVLSCLTISHPFNINSLPSQQLRNGHGLGSRLHRFGSTLQHKDHRSSNRSTPAGAGLKPSLHHRAPDAELDFLRGGFGLETKISAATSPSPSPPPPFPYSVKTNVNVNGNNDNSQAYRLILRHLEEEDILHIMPEIIREFGSLAQSSTASSLNAKGDGFATQIENFLFSFTVLFGLTQRVARRKKGYSSSTDRKCRPDHNVICLVEQRCVRHNVDNGGNSSNSINNVDTNNFHGIKAGLGQNWHVEEGNFLIEEKIVGIAELSWQPPVPNRNAPPYILPYFIKMMISQFLSPPSARKIDANITIGPKGYISNVLVWKNHRGRGYSRVLMAALEGIAKLWGCTDIRLHVDADEQSGNIAQQLYDSLGYVGVPDRGTTKSHGVVGYEWMGPSMAHEGLYFVDGLPLLYLRKCL